MQPSPRLSRCVRDGDTVTCTDQDSNGYVSPSSNGLRLTVAPGATLYNATVRYNQRIYSSSEVVHFDGNEHGFTVYVDLHNRWTVGMNRIKDGEMRRTAAPR